MRTLDAPCGCNACSGARPTLDKRPCERSGATARKGDWLQTFTGKQYWPLDPRPEDVDIIDIAAALSKLCRYGGHCLRFYSVAEHSVLMARAAPEHLRAATLLHDAPEGYVVDLVRPIKDHVPGYREIERLNAVAISCRFLTPWPLPVEVKALDEGIGLAEAAANMAPAPAPWKNRFHASAPLDVEFGYWAPDRAFAEFMREATACGLLAS